MYGFSRPTRIGCSAELARRRARDEGRIGDRATVVGAQREDLARHLGAECQAPRSWPCRRRWRRPLCRRPPDRWRCGSGTVLSGRHTRPPRSPPPATRHRSAPPGRWHRACRSAQSPSRRRRWRRGRSRGRRRCWAAPLRGAAGAGGLVDGRARDLVPVRNGIGTGARDRDGGRCGRGVAAVAATGNENGACDDRERSGEPGKGSCHGESLHRLRSQGANDSGPLSRRRSTLRKPMRRGQRRPTKPWTGTAKVAGVAMNEEPSRLPRRTTTSAR